MPPKVCPPWVPYGPSLAPRSSLPKLTKSKNGKQQTSTAESVNAQHKSPTLQKHKRQNGSSQRLPSRTNNVKGRDSSNADSIADGNEDDLCRSTSDQDEGHTSESDETKSSPATGRDETSHLSETPDSSVQDNDSVTEDTENEESIPADPICQALGDTPCVAQSCDYRKVITQFFGRNKRCTIDIPDHLWVRWCRKHYQRFTYRGTKEATWHIMQLRMVKQQLTMFEKSKVVRSWEIAVRKNALTKLSHEDDRVARGLTPVESGEDVCHERFLLPFVGYGKTYEDVREVLGVIEAEFNSAQFCRRANKAKEFPNVEFLPTIYSTVRDSTKQTSKIIPVNHHKRKTPPSKAESPVKKPKLSLALAAASVILTNSTASVSNGTGPGESAIEPSSDSKQSTNAARNGMPAINRESVARLPKIRKRKDTTLSNADGKKNMDTTTAMPLARQGRKSLPTISESDIDIDAAVPSTIATTVSSDGQMMKDFDEKIASLKDKENVGLEKTQSRKRRRVDSGLASVKVEAAGVAKTRVTNGFTPINN